MSTCFQSTGDVPDLTADPSLANKELGFTCKYGLEEMARDQWGFNKKYPQGKSELPLVAR